MAFRATRALNSGLWVRRLVNSCGSGFANGGFPGSGRCPVSVVNDVPGQEGPDSLTRFLVENAYEGWVKRGKINLHIFKRIRALLQDPVMAMTSKPSKRSITCRICHFVNN